MTSPMLKQKLMNKVPANPNKKSAKERKIMRLKNDLNALNQVLNQMNQSIKISVQSLNEIEEIFKSILPPK